MALVAVGAVDDEGIGRDLPAEAVVAVALGQQGAVEQAARLQHAIDLRHRAADDAGVAVVDDVERQHVVEAGVGIGQLGHQAVAEGDGRSEEHTSELQSLMRISYAVFCLKKKKSNQKHNNFTQYLQDNKILFSTQSTTQYTMPIITSRTLMLNHTTNTVTPNNYTVEYHTTHSKSGQTHV